MGMALFHHLLGEAGKDIIGSASTLVVKSLAPSVLVQELRAIIDHTTPHHTYKTFVIYRKENFGSSLRICQAVDSKICPACF